MTLEITPASGDDYVIVRNMARFYVYDMAEHAGWPFPADGGFEAGEIFASYWGRPGASRAWPQEWQGFPFLVRVDGHPAGFALVKRIAPGTHDMGEFFIGRQHRRGGVGRLVANRLFDSFAGVWEVREMLTNVAAQAFWHRVVADYTQGDFTQTREAFAAYDGKEFVVQRFHARGKSA